MAEASPDFLVEIHQDLARKWKLHGAKIEKIWRSMDQKTRLEAIKAGAADGVVLKNPSDSSLGNVHKFIPEWNTQEVAAAESDFLLDMLRYRATKTLEDQYHAGFNGRPGDYELIVHSMQKKNLRHKEPFEDCYTFFMDGERYGHSYKVKLDKEGTLKAFGPAIKAGVCVPQAVGELVLTRQTYLLQCLNIIIGDILDLGSKTRNTKNVAKRTLDSATESLAKMGIQNSTKADLPDVISTAADQSSALEARLDLLRTEPVALEHAVNCAFYTRPEIVPDERGRSMPSLHDKFISGAVLDAVLGAVKNAATWRYVSRILDLYSTETDKALKATVAQELANICNQEYLRCQNALKRALATSLGTKWFKRLSNGSDNGVARLAIKGDPTLLLREDPLLHHLLRLCQPDTTATKAIDWIQQLDGLRQSHPMDWERLVSVAYYALGDLITIVLFTQSLGQAISVPAFSRKKGQQFVAESSKLETEMNKIKPELDLTEFAAPLEMLLEPGMAEQALKKLDDFIVDKSGAQIGFLYEDLISGCVQNLEAIKENSSKGSGDQRDAFVPLPAADTATTAQAQIQQRREKAKTRPTQSSTLAITTPAEGTKAADKDNIETTEQSAEPRVSVKGTTAKTFATIFSKSEKRSPITWTAFEAAMGDCGFAVVPKQGSIYTFELPSTNVAENDAGLGKNATAAGDNKGTVSHSTGYSSITTHRPHQSIIEGYDLLYLASRLRRRFGWSASTFEVSS
ncbi:ipa protein [Microdochium trichocladiopsis]|uniref:Ipa protein n=1 Tax=Microdochium trichocladiopsis TaxID=1682393 RepID=A0A9P8Y453_9PEZI|nr:ipa protein [Microdochium trichocladiopsis]KAH7029015.1 ipa protein [Microdochium trichocladiopsis]